jgi:hypothetical protein
MRSRDLVWRPYRVPNGQGHSSRRRSYAMTALWLTLLILSFIAARRDWHRLRKQDYALDSRRPQMSSNPSRRGG